MATLCVICKRKRDNTIRDPENGLSYCQDCVASLPVPSHVLGQLYLFNTIPFKVGDVVECRTAGVLFDGIGVVEDIYLDPERGGTPVYPAFRVSLIEKAYEEAPDEGTYTEMCLTKVSDNE